MSDAVATPNREAEAEAVKMLAEHRKASSSYSSTSELSQWSESETEESPLQQRPSSASDVSSHGEGELLEGPT